MAGSYYTSVQRILAQVSNGVTEGFSHMKTDADRLAFVLDLPFVDENFHITSEFSGKSSMEAKKWRDKGNQVYQKQNFKDAVEYYTKALLNAPVYEEEAEDQEEREFALALANRSAALFQTRQTERALSDIRLALKYGYPRALEYKLYDRMGKCFLDLERHEDAGEAFRKAKASLEHANLDEKRTKLWVDALEKELSLTDLKPEAKKGKKEKRVTFQGVRENVPVVMGNPSRKFPCASEAFDIRCAQGKGRYAVARRQVSVGDVLVAEKPFVSVLSYDLYPSHCHHCLKQLEAPLACQQCSFVRYCSETCQQESWEKYHQTECQILKHIRNSGIGFMGHLTLRIILTTGLQGLLSSKRVAAESDEKGAKLQTPLHLLVDNRGNYVGGFDALYDLVTHTNHRSNNELFQYTLLAIYLLKILKSTSWLETSVQDGWDLDMPEEELHVFVGSVMLRFLQIISCNGVEVAETHCGQNIQKAEQITLGLAMYPTVSLINHSCNPAMELIFYGDVCVLKAIRNLADREELSIDYGYVYYLTERQQREMALKSQYFFKCVCEPCQEDWPVRNKLPNGIPTFKCSSCGTPLSMYGGEKADPTAVKCRKCGLRHKPLAYLETLQESSRLFDKALSEAKSGKTDKAIPILENHLCLMEKYLCLPWKDYITCLSTLKQCYRVLGNRARKK